MDESLVQASRVCLFDGFGCLWYDSASMAFVIHD